MLMVTGPPAGRRAGGSAFAGGKRKQHVRNSPPWEHHRQRVGGACLLPEHARERERHRRLDRNQRHDQACNGERLVRDQAEIDRHAHRHEEEAQQQPLERLDIGLDLVPVLGAREQHAGDERAERHRDAELVHEDADRQHHQQRARREHLLAAGLRQHAKVRAQQVAPAHNGGNSSTVTTGEKPPAASRLRRVPP
jgi:hypothetical protein